jgi:hypothetical protein
MPTRIVGIDTPDLQPSHLRLDQDPLSPVDLTFQKMEYVHPDAIEQFSPHDRKRSLVGRKLSVQV